MARLHLVRHGQTDWNARRLYQGSKDIPLNERGRFQASQAALKLKSVPFVATYSSYLTRAHETALLIKGDRPHTVQIDHNLHEGSFGALEGKPYIDINSPLREKQRALSNSEKLHHKFVPDQESAHEVTQRALPSLKKIALAHQDQDVLVVTHGGVIRSLLVHLENWDFNEIRIENTQVLILEYLQEKWSFLQ